MHKCFQVKEFPVIKGEHTHKNTSKNQKVVNYTKGANHN